MWFKDKKKYCTNCGSELPDNANFCIECGQKISKDSESDNESMEEITTMSKI